MANLDLSSQPTAPLSGSGARAGDPSASSEDLERLRRFGDALDALKARIEAEVGEDDVRHVRRMRAISIACEIGRAHV
jgi:hypothetical protein